MRRSLPLAWKQTVVLAGMMVMFPLLSLALHWFGYKRVSSFLTAFSLNPLINLNSTQHALPMSYMLAQVVNRAAQQSPHKATCLERSMMLWWLLRWLRISSHLRVGVRRENGQILAHAWVEYQGIIVNDRADIHQYYVSFSDKLSPEMVGRFD